MIVLRDATAADAPLMRRWDDQPHVLASDPNDDWDWEKELDRPVDAARRPLVASR